MMISAIIISIVTMFGLQIALLAYLSIRKHRRNKYESELNQLYESLIDSFTSYMVGMDKQLFINKIESVRYGPVLIERLLNNYVAVMKGSAVSPEVRALSETYLTGTYTAVMKKKIGRNESTRFTISRILVCIHCPHCFENVFLKWRNWI